MGKLTGKSMTHLYLDSSMVFVISNVFQNVRTSFKDYWVRLTGSQSVLRILMHWSSSASEGASLALSNLVSKFSNLTHVSYGVGLMLKIVKFRGEMMERRGGGGCEKEKWVLVSLADLGPPQTPIRSSKNDDVTLAGAKTPDVKWKPN